MDREYLHYRAADILSQVLPRRFAYWIGLRVADGHYRRDVRGREAVKANLRHRESVEGGGSKVEAEPECARPHAAVENRLAIRRPCATVFAIAC